MKFLKRRKTKDIEEKTENELAGSALPETAGPDAPSDAPPSPGRLVDRLRDRLAQTRAVLTSRVDHLALGVKEIDEDVLEELEEILITSDMGVAATKALIQAVGKGSARHKLGSSGYLRNILADELLKILSLEPFAPPQARPYVILVVGVNGVGKTTTIAKLALRYKNQGKKVMLAAGDTFRAAAVEQLTIWAERVGCEIVRQGHGADPSAVAYDAVEAAQARGVDVLLIDTAGRLHTKSNLMEELKKIHRVIGKKLEGAPHEVLLVLDAATGQNAVSQARLFHEAVGVSQVAMTKLDGSPKGGILAAIAHELKLPIRYIGLGESMEDLRDFDPRAFIRALFE